ncbi:hypothetical protein R3P38DRAFT_2872924 [Favolaschia claudopus]|uniref:Uncharacterized protein n=1 Tax=Favolaschia claudopus TaxID=2862362 RepID=A0AAW0DCU7_9AGAR
MRVRRIVTSANVADDVVHLVIAVPLSSAREEGDEAAHDVVVVLGMGGLSWSSGRGGGRYKGGRGCGCRRGDSRGGWSRRDRGGEAGDGALKLVDAIEQGGEDARIDLVDCEHGVVELPILVVLRVEEVLSNTVHLVDVLLYGGHELNHIVHFVRQSAHAVVVPYSRSEQPVQIFKDRRYLSRRVFFSRPRWVEGLEATKSSKGVGGVGRGSFRCGSSGRASRRRRRAGWCARWRRRGAIDRGCRGDGNERRWRRGLLRS